MQTETWIDKAAWGDGPWRDEPDRAEWRDKSTGLTCLALRHSNIGQWCGYVAVPPGHPWHGLDYDDMPVEAHGGLTFVGRCQVDDRPAREQICHVPQPGEPDDVWWIGFDCLHLWDIGPAMEARERALGFPEYRELMSTRRSYKTLEYVRSECTNLAAQVHAQQSGPAH